ncbi:MAG: TIM barrel protein [Paracoccaceae bacterium]
MTIPQSSATELFDMAQSLGFVGVELRNDLPTALFDGKDAREIGKNAKERGLRILALAEVYGFNKNSAEKQAEALNLARQAKNCGAEAIALIPRIEDAPVARSEQRDLLKEALIALQPMLENVGMVALIECLGFANSSLRLKADAVAVLEEMERPACFGLIHDTFHHALAEEVAIFADLTHIVHISGVTDQRIGYSDMTDAHRGLVDCNDTIGNLAQITRLRSAGYTGPFSFEAFSPTVHELNDPTDALSESVAFISSQVANMAA